MSTQHFTRSEDLLNITGLNKSYNGTPIIKNLSAKIQKIHRDDVKQGQVVSLVGPSGIGKTTLFRLISGLESPDSGSIILESNTQVKTGMVGVVAQNYPLFEHRTILANMLVVGDHKGVGRSELREKANQILSVFEIANHKDKYPCQLSGGQRQRAAIAQQFMCSEHFVLMDEPFSGLDILAEDKVINFIKRTSNLDELKTFIIVTHDISAALAVSDTIWVLGRDRSESGEVIPGSYIKHTYDLASMGIAWQDNVTTTSEYLELRKEIQGLFPSL